MATVLIVDDEENNRLLIAMLLEHAGHTALQAQSGREGLGVAVSALPDAIVIDLSLPDISGIEVIRRLRREPRTKKMKIALYTATQTTPALDELVDIYGISCVIPQPGDPQQILEAIARLTHSYTSKR